MYGNGYSMAIVLDHRSTATSLTGNDKDIGDNTCMYPTLFRSFLCEQHLIHSLEVSRCQVIHSQKR